MQLPDLSTALASSTAGVTLLINYFWPIIPYVFAITIVVGAFKIMVAGFHYFANKAGDIVNINHRMANHRIDAQQKIADSAQLDKDWELWRKSKGY